MIDTIVLTLKEGMFIINDHTKFSPSTEGLFNPSGYYRLGSRSNMVCKQNPTPSELKNGIYKPRLTVTKRINRYGNFEVMMKIEFSIPKLLFGNNFDEIEEADFQQVVQTLKIKLREMGVLIFEYRLAKAPISAIHYSKNIPLTDYTTPYTYIELLSKANINQRLDLNQTDFRNEGHSLKYRANSFEIVFYDKLSDLNKAKTSEKRAEEQDNTIQLNLFDNIVIQKPFEVLRMEVRLNRKQKLIQMLKKLGIEQEPTFQLLFSKDIAKKVLLHYIDEIEASYPALLSYEYTNSKDFLWSFMFNNPKAGIRKAIQMLGLRVAFAEVGIREFREITKRFGKNSWYRLNSELNSLVYPQKEDVFSVLKTVIETFKPLKLIDFQDNLLNNVKVS